MSRNCCDFDCNQGRDCPARIAAADDLCHPLSTTEAALLSLIVLACTGLCVYLIVVFLQFMGV